MACGIDASEMSSERDPSPFDRRVRRRRYELAGHARFLTFGCFQRVPLFADDGLKDLFVAHLAASRAQHGFLLHAYVVMPDHVHLLITPRSPDNTVTMILHHLKRSCALAAMRQIEKTNPAAMARLVGMDGRRRFWQRGGGYDRNIFTMDEAIEKTRYIHANPLRKGLVEEPCAYRWSSAAWWEERREGALELDWFE
jgi:putative transposase